MALTAPKTVDGLAEFSVIWALSQTIDPALIPQSSILFSDESEVKPSAPYIVVHCDPAEEQISPGCGIFKVHCKISYYSHVKPDSGNTRDTVKSQIYDFLWGNPRNYLNTVFPAIPFYCHGVQPIGNNTEVDEEKKTYVELVEFDIYCMPRTNG